MRGEEADAVTRWLVHDCGVGVPSVLISITGNPDPSPSPSPNPNPNPNPDPNPNLDSNPNLNPNPNPNPNQVERRTSACRRMCRPPSSEA